MARVLVVDDSRVARLMSRRLLEKLGHEVTESSSVDEAWQALSGPALVDLVLLDWNMPGGNGLTLVSLMQETTATSRIPVVFATSDTDIIHQEYAAEAGASGYIVKPFTAEQLGQAVQSALSRLA